MKLPKYIQIHGNKIRIFEVENLTDAYGTPIHGCYKPPALAICIEKKLKGKEKLHTFLHEYGHAVIHALGVYNCNLSHDLEEIIVDGIAKSLSENFVLRFRA